MGAICPVEQSHTCEKCETEEKKGSKQTYTVVNKCQCQTHIRWMGVILIILALEVGTVGLLTYLGHMQLGFQSIGMISNHAALAIAITGYGLAALSITVIIAVCLKNCCSKTPIAKTV